MPSLICKRTVRFARLINRTRVQFHDRCVVCTAALCQSGSDTLSHPFLPPNWSASKRKQSTKARVFFIRNLGFVTPTEVRRISFEEAVRFEKLHEQTYRDFGFEDWSQSSRRRSVAERVGIIKSGDSLMSKRTIRIQVAVVARSQHPQPRQLVGNACGSQVRFWKTSPVRRRNRLRCLVS